MHTILVQNSDAASLLVQLNGKDAIETIPVRCFPWTHKDRYISLRTLQNSEVLYIEDLQSLDDASRAALESVLRKLDFLLVVTRVNYIHIEYEIRNWGVETCQGPYQFQTKLDDWPQTINATSLLIQDVSGNLLKIEDTKTLDAHSQKLLWPFLD